MALAQKFQSTYIESVRLLCIILFVYAALNKILDFENFQVQLGQSPLLSAYASPVSYAVPLFEFGIVFLLLIPRCLYISLFASFTLMTMFTAYIFIMLYYSPFVPCSCGGILEKMTWNEHLIFNVVFVVLLLFAIILYRWEEQDSLSLKIRAGALVATVIFSIAVVYSLFVFSEDTTHTQNNFTRLYPNHPTVPVADIDLKFNSYYIAGYDEDHVYLGNSTAPLTVTSIGLRDLKMNQYSVGIPKFPFTYTAPRLQVRSPYFYFSDGSIPCVFRGNVADWIGKLVMRNQKAYFSSFEPIDKTNAIVRCTSGKTGENVLATLQYPDSIYLNYGILEKQIDGVFDTDGMLLYNQQLKRTVYTHYYRNQYITTDTSLKSRQTGNTIDTISRAQIKVAKIHSKKITTLAEQPKLVNRRTATYGNYLFVNSALIGRFEPKDVWKQASVIDVYNIVDKTYAFSFYTYDRQQVKMRDFIVIDDLVISMIGQRLIFERLETSYYSPWKPK